jgi:hypothetical protein
MISRQVMFVYFAIHSFKNVILKKMENCLPVSGIFFSFQKFADNLVCWDLATVKKQKILCITSVQQQYTSNNVNTFLHRRQDNFGRQYCI